MLTKGNSKRGIPALDQKIDTQVAAEGKNRLPLLMGQLEVMECRDE